ncbi:hypothetical protein O0I10_005838 [Lichtheimia ornata]|uniref:Rab-GAP TBC domain-containing protein n=1 Tax=Lichtheimia ornata TaxID=688661 RepID=A0AAD7V578_9FUNG|nr:uncharacterized protein O0I10_005838 [Lichtheimia ornata]KAJ8658485.1 hypothetical protein O0I10_005838 [Lichtheimia ornata]
MDSLQVPEPPSVVSASKSTPLKKAATADYVSTPNLLHQSRSLDPGTMSIYAAAAYDANNIRRQRSESFVQHHHQRKSKQRWLQEHSDQDFMVRAPSQMCLTRHHLVSPPMPSLNTHHHALDTEIYHQHHTSNGSNNSNSDRRSSVTSETSSSNSSQDVSGTSTTTTTSATVIKSMEATKHEYFPPTTDNTGALLGGVLIRRAVRPSLMETMTSNTDNNTTTTTTTSHKEQSKKSDSPSSSSSSKNNTTTTIDTALTSMTTQERWTPPPIMSPESLYDDGKIPFSSTPTSPSTSNRNLFKLKKSNSHSSSSSPSLFHFKRFGSKHELDPSDNAKLVSPPPPVSFEENPETDCYGFRKASQWVTLEDHHAHEESYQAVLERRLSKWEQLLKEHESRLPERCSKVKRYIRKGVPAHLRGRVWLHYSGAEAKMDSNPGVYEKFLAKAEAMGDTNEFADIIARDLHRTFPDNIQFRTASSFNNNNNNNHHASMGSTAALHSPAIIGALRRVLSAFSIYSPSIGYCQSLNYIVGMLLLFMKEEEAFWTLVTIVQNLLPAGVYDVTMEGSNIDQTVLMMLIWERMPHLWNKLSDKSSFWDSAADSASMPTITLVTNHWFLTLFINILPIETVLRVWDCFFYEGSSALFRVALTLFKMSENLIMSLKDSLEIFQVIQNMPKRIIDCQMLMENTFQRHGSLTHVTHEDLERRREMCRDRRRSGRIPTHSKSRTLPRWKLRAK